MSCFNPEPHGPHQYLADADAVTLSPCAGSGPSRPGWHEYGLGLARAASVRGDCTRRQVGAVILDGQHRVVSVGYNGSYPGGPSCLEGECPRGRHYEVIPTLAGLTACETDLCDCDEGPRRECACGNAWPCPDAVPAGSSYDTGPGACIAVHAEMNALLAVDDRSRLLGAVLYVTAEPCDGCLKILRSTALREIHWDDGAGGHWSTAP